MSRPISAAFGKGSGRARGTLKTQTGGLENPDGRSGRAQAELGAEDCTRRRRSSHIDALLTVPITASCWVGVVDKAVVAMSEARERLHGTPPTATLTTRLSPSRAGIAKTAARLPSECLRFLSQSRHVSWQIGRQVA